MSTGSNRLTLSIVQTHLHWHDPARNLDDFAQKLSPLAAKTDIVILPEMFTSGFTVYPEYLHTAMGMKTVDWMQQQAKALHASIVGSLACELSRDERQVPVYVNRLFFVSPDGSTNHYDKVHLFRMGDEHLRYQPGHQRFILKYRGWSILLIICYDLRFPVFCRNRSNEYDLMICVANWPESRRLHWCSLLQARAIENQCYVAGVNRVGEDDKGLCYSGDSCVIDYLGNSLCDANIGEEFVGTTTLNLSALTSYRRDFPVWSDADDFTCPLMD